MPELPEIEVARRLVDERLSGRRLEDVWLKRTGKTSMHGEKLLDELPGRRLLTAERRGKMLLLDFERDLTLLIHLMLIGRLALYQGERQSRVEPRLRLRFDDESRFEVRFVAAGSLGLLPSPQVPAYPAVAKLGSDALAVTLDQFREALGRVRGPAKEVLMDQELVAGVGNAYADEIFFEAQINPLVPAAALAEQQVRDLHNAVAPVLRRAIDLGAAREYIHGMGEASPLTKKEELMRVHGRAGAPCPRCGATVEVVERGGRGTFFCPRCQPR